MTPEERSIDEIYYAICALQNAAESAVNRAKGVDAYDRAKELRRIAEEAYAAYPKVAEIFKKGLLAKANSESSYDAYVTSPPDCSEAEQAAAEKARAEVEADYEEWANDVRRLTRELDVELHGEGAAEQASLCDIVGMIKPAIEKARMEEREACAQQVRHDCTACEGTGHADADTECEYCGRPMAAIRARGEGEGDG